MSKEEQAKVILESLDAYVNVNWNMEDVYLKAIIEGLDKIQKSDIKKSYGDFSLGFFYIPTNESALAKTERNQQGNWRSPCATLVVPTTRDLTIQSKK